ncbi:MAG: lanthionine synthetase LanC family protein [Lachnospiraceae bacterium]
MIKIIPYLFKKTTKEDYLQTALETAEWIKQYEVIEDIGKTWRPYPKGQNGANESFVLGKKNFYAGSSGIGFFFLRLYQATDDKRWLEEALSAAAYLLARETDISFYRNIQDQLANKKDKIYGWAFSYKVGPISEGQFIYSLYEETGKQEYYDFAVRQADTFIEAAIADEWGLHWSDARDIVGDAGGIVYLIQVYRQTGDHKYLDAAIQGGNYIEHFGHPAKNGGTYYDLYDVHLAGEGEKGTVHVNFSHGSAGTGYLWAILYEATKDEKYLKLAQDVVAYLDGISLGDDIAVLLPFQDHPDKGSDTDKFYLGMCGGPIGTSFFFKKLYEITGDTVYLDWVNRLAHGLVRAGVPERKSWGYWGSKCICCGGPGALEYFAAMYEFTQNDLYREYAVKTADILISESNTEKNSRTWFGAWDRTKPDRVVSYLGFYIGAAGAAGSLLKLYGTLTKTKISDFFEYYL